VKVEIFRIAEVCFGIEDVTTEACFGSPASTKPRISKFFSGKTC
jgi:hypothetical protein